MMSGNCGDESWCWCWCRQREVERKINTPDISGSGWAEVSDLIGTLVVREGR